MEGSVLVTPTVGAEDHDRVFHAAYVALIGAAVAPDGKRDRIAQQGVGSYIQKRIRVGDMGFLGSRVAPRLLDACPVLIAVIPRTGQGFTPLCIGPWGGAFNKERELVDRGDTEPV
ncbi:hypothetical protein SDC9_146986 [bioreactor metagenome]|uniref:Uncharacterized protein n=1 Tax=bioreactor metagenome TaxID=1076179 RepID=A0A645EGR7_9ZZZZ